MKSQRRGRGKEPRNMLTVVPPISRVIGFILLAQHRQSRPAEQRSCCDSHEWHQGKDHCPSANPNTKHATKKEIGAESGQKSALSDRNGSGPWGISWSKLAPTLDKNRVDIRTAYDQLPLCGQNKDLPRLAYQALMLGSHAFLSSCRKILVGCTMTV